MKKVHLAAIASLAMASAASAQYVERVWDRDQSVWVVTSVEIKPGQGNAYMKYWRDVVLPRIEYGKAKGNILGYRVFQNLNARDGEPDMWVMVQHKSMATYDQPISYFEDMDKQLAGGGEGRAKQLATGRDLGTVMGQTLLKEVSFPK